MWRKLKYAIQRARKGYDDSDTWSFDSWFCRIAPKILRELAYYSDGYPEEYGSLEKWQREIYELATRIEELGKDWVWERNEWTKEYMEALEKKSKDKGVAYERWHSRMVELAEEQNKEVKDVFKKLGEVFYKLWN